MGDEEEKTVKKGKGCFLFTFIAFVMIILYFNYFSPKPEYPKPLLDSSTANINSNSITVNGDSLKKLYRTTIKKFIVKKDEFSSRVSYYHKTWGDHWATRCTLTADVDNEGNIWLCSNYFRSDWIFHKYVIVKVGNLTLQTPSLETYDSNCRTQIVDGGVYEVNSYGSKESKEILSAIATTQDEPVKVRFEGTQYYYDVTMNTTDKRAIKDCVNLSDLITVMNRNYVSLD